MPAQQSAPKPGLLRTFANFPEISPDTLAVLQSQGFETATPVQEATIPLFSGNKDVAVDACTGSGKTLAFIVPLTEKLRRLEERLKKSSVGALIVSPTRELAQQTFKVATPFLQSVPGITAQLLVGGNDPSKDVELLRREGGQVLIGTPGRLHDIIRRATFLTFKKLEVLILDEADRLLDMGFKKQLDAIMVALPKQRRTGLFSATQTEAVQQLTRAGLRNPVRVAVTVSGPGAAEGAGAAATSGGTDSQVTPSSLQLGYSVMSPQEKVSQLVAFLSKHRDKKVIVYFMTCATVDYFSLVLPRLKPLAGISIRPLHGKLKQAAREAALAAFASEAAGVVLCTDVAARGLDIPDVNWILQFDPPQDPAAFVHRVGRTARMGRSGSAMVYLLPSETAYVSFLSNRKVPLVEQPCLAPALPVLPLLRRESETDREAMEKSVRAFIAFIRGYKEHDCKFIFRFPELPLGEVAMSYSLLYLPKMPEVKKSKLLEGFEPSTVDVGTITYRDKAREKQRVANLKRAEADSKAAAIADTQEKMRIQREKASKPDKKLPAAKRKKIAMRDELVELNEEYTLLKKLKKGKMTNAEFDKATGLISDDEGDAG